MGKKNPSFSRDIVQLGLLYISSIFSVFFKNVIRLINIIKMHRNLGGAEAEEARFLRTKAVKEGKKARGQSIGLVIEEEAVEERGWEEDWQGGWAPRTSLTHLRRGWGRSGPGTGTGRQ